MKEEKGQMRRGKAIRHSPSLCGVITPLKLNTSLEMDRMSSEDC